MVDQITQLFPHLLGATVPDQLHVCGTSCPTPCPRIGAVVFPAQTIDPGHVLLEHYVDVTAGRVVITMPVATLAEHLSEHDGDAPLTYASATAALRAKGGDTGLQTYLDDWHAAGTLP